MKRDIDILLMKLEPEIDQKCSEIKKERKENKLFILLLALFMIVPVMLFILNISFLYFVLGVVLISSLVIFIKLPDLLKQNSEVVYE